MTTTKKKTTDKDKGAKLRNRGDCVFPAKSSKVKDDKDHFPINSEKQARNALARASQYSSSPSWYAGSLESLVNAVARKVHSKYKGIEVSKDGKTPGKKKKASVETSANFSLVLNKLIELKASNTEDYRSAVNALEDKVEFGEEHNGWTPAQLEQLLENLE